jgi:quercetin dioxygenase-like cupin family protein
MRISSAIAFLLLAASNPFLEGQDPLIAAPEHFKLSFENEKVRVVELRVRPGAKVPLHSHPARFTYVLASAKVKTAFADGREKIEERPIGASNWGEPVAPHTHENIGATEYRLLIYYPKCSSE